MKEWLEMSFAESDQSWLLFTSHPLTFTCDTVNASVSLEADPYWPGADSEQGAAEALAHGGLSAVLRLALLNNCTNGHGPACSAYESNSITTSSGTSSSDVAEAGAAAPDDSNSHTSNSTDSSSTGDAVNNGVAAASADVAAWRSVLVANADLYPTEASSVFYEVHEGSGKSSSSSNNDDDAFDDTSSATDDSSLGGSSTTATLVFDWSPRSMKGAASSSSSSSDADSSKKEQHRSGHTSAASTTSSSSSFSSEIKSSSTRGAVNSATEGVAAPLDTSTSSAMASSPNVLMYALQHHWTSLTGPVEVSAFGRLATVRGVVAPVTGASSSWTQSLPLPRLAFQASAPIANGRRAALNEALNVDLNYKLPLEYELAAGSTYVGGKMLAKLARLALVAEELGRHADAMVLADRLADSLEVRQ